VQQIRHKFKIQKVDKMEGKRQRNKLYFKQFSIFELFSLIKVKVLISFA
jgi:hypothetical protein